MLPSRAVNNYHIILNVIKYIVYIYVWFQNNPGQVNILNAHTTPVKIYGESYANKFCVVDILWNITHRQSISPVAKFHHVLGRGFRIQQVILIFIKRLSANQNESFT